ncbi:hypothetical protein, partial [Mesorhizobium sp. M0589]|uniref:hypothetical protein n=1 Tax=Mesorhizobium sp. M0589 TaxID=2956965 RepID=UPI003338350F
MVSPAQNGSRAWQRKLQIPLAFHPMSETEPVRRLTRLSKAEPSILAAAEMLARMIVDASPIARNRCHVFGKPARFVAHSGLIGPTRPGW